MDFTFSELLRGFRKRSSMTQGELASALRVSRVTVGHWEGATYLPKTREMILALASELSLSPAETDQLLRAASYPDEHGTPPATATSHQLRAPVGDFVGRADEIGQLVQALRRATDVGGIAALAGVQGMAGIGKTELAYVVAHRVRSLFPDAQLVLALGGTGPAALTPEQALQRVLRVFMPQARLPDALPDLQGLYCAQLYAKRVLILADDASDAAQVRPLLPPAGSALLITSRRRFVLPAMHTINLEQLPAGEASKLLHSICPHLSENEAAELARTCGYLPLALRVSASLLYVSSMLKVVDYLALLADERQRPIYLRDPSDASLDVEASILVSYRQLDTAVQSVFRQLGVFAAPINLALAQAVIASPPGTDVGTVLDLLARHNLTMYDAQRERWRLHDLVHGVARRQMNCAGETAATRWRYVQAVVHLAQALNVRYETGGDESLTALAQFDIERPHIDEAYRWATEHRGTPEGDRLLLDAVMATVSIGELRYDARQERIPQWTRAVEAAQQLGDMFGEAVAWKNLGNTHRALGDVSLAIDAYKASLALACALGDLRAQGNALGSLGNAYAEIGDAQQAIPYFIQCRTIMHDLGERRREGMSLGNLGNAYRMLGDTERAIAACEQAVAIAREVGDRRGKGITLNNLGIAFMHLGDARRAMTYFEQRLVVARELGDRRGEGIALGNLGNAWVELGEAARAVDACEQAITIAKAIGDQRGEAYALIYLARAQALLRHSSHAQTTFDQALVLLQAIADRLGEAECCWYYSIFLLQQGERDAGLHLLRAAVAFEQEVGHARAAEHAGLLARLEAGAELPPELSPPGGDTAIALGEDQPGA
ncbi:MAG TPA: tetratricopeptide repeat protein [Roseiflexaceae bacterium]|nr:tetratricopeptide repeat protein [Roseiflexaceae bacterium]